MVTNFREFRLPKGFNRAQALSRTRVRVKVGSEGRLPSLQRQRRLFGAKTGRKGRVKVERRFRAETGHIRKKPASGGLRDDSAVMSRQHRDGGFAEKLVRLAGFEPTTFSSGG